MVGAALSILRTGPGSSCARKGHGVWLSGTAATRGWSLTDRASPPSMVKGADGPQRSDCRGQALSKGRGYVRATTKVPADADPSGCEKGRPGLKPCWSNAPGRLGARRAAISNFFASVVAAVRRRQPAQLPPRGLRRSTICSRTARNSRISVLTFRSPLEGSEGQASRHSACQPLASRPSSCRLPERPEPEIATMFRSKCRSSRSPLRVKDYQAFAT